MPPPPNKQNTPPPPGNKRRAPQNLDLDVSKVEELPKGMQPEVKRTLGKMEREDSEAMLSPKEIKKGLHSHQPGSVGLRAAAPTTSNQSSKATQRHQETQAKLKETKYEHRQTVWDKLDTARKTAQDKNARLQQFTPKRST